MLIFFTAMYAMIINSWTEFWDKYTPEEYEIGVLLWHKLY